MLPITPYHYLVLSAAVFMIGVIGVMLRRNIIIIFMSIELMLNAVNINLAAFSQQWQRCSRFSSSPWRPPKRPWVWGSSCRSIGTRTRSISTR
jgi:NADH-ubiquinone/plastoquinone oxidoreductase chain 4L